MEDGVIRDTARQLKHAESRASQFDARRKAYLALASLLDSSLPCLLLNFF